MNKIKKLSNMLVNFQRMGHGSSCLFKQRLLVDHVVLEFVLEKNNLGVEGVLLLGGQSLIDYSYYSYLSKALMKS